MASATYSPFLFAELPALLRLRLHHPAPLSTDRRQYLLSNPIGHLAETYVVLGLCICVSCRRCIHAQWVCFAGGDLVFVSPKPNGCQADGRS